MPIDRGTMMIFNTFDWVIQCFQEVLKHGHAQAEQLSMIIHFKGKATV